MNTPEPTTNEKYGRPLRVFISSNCDKKKKGKYTTLRKATKKLLNAQPFIEAYIFECEGASSLTAKEHYKLQLEDADLCIVIIDNKDGINPGVETELQVIAEKKIKTLYYFCDQHLKTPTEIQKNLSHADKPKYKTIHSFQNLEQTILRDIIDDLILVYANTNYSNNNEKYNIPTSFILNYLNSSSQTLADILNISFASQYKSKSNTCSWDEWTNLFLPVLFGQKSIKEFNSSMFLNTLKESQSKEYHKLITIRWNAIHAYFSGDLKACLKHLEDAYTYACKSNQQEWILNDILIDLRNIQFKAIQTNELITIQTDAQDKLNKNNDIVYYPIIDRLELDLSNEYQNRALQKFTTAPNSITIINFHENEIIAAILAIAMLNGSLTHILRTFTHLRNFLISYIDWTQHKQAQYDLLKILIRQQQNKEAYQFVINTGLDQIMTEELAMELITHSHASPLAYEKMQSWLISFGIAGYYLSDSNFQEHEKIFFDFIDKWSLSINKSYYTGEYIISTFSHLHERLNKDKLINACSKLLSLKSFTITKQLYTLFKIININDFNTENRKTLLQAIIQNTIDGLNYNFLINWCSRFPELYTPFINLIDPKDLEIIKKIKIRKAITSTSSQAMEIIQQNINNYKNDKVQCLANIKYVMFHTDCNYPDSLLKQLISIASDLILSKHHTKNEKLQAIYLLFILESKFHNNIDKALYDNLYEGQNIIETRLDFGSSGTTDSLIIRTLLSLFFSNIEYQTLNNFIDNTHLIPEDEISELIKPITDIMEICDINSIETNELLSNYSLSWINSSDESNRFYAIKLLFILTSNQHIKYPLENIFLCHLKEENINTKKLIIKYALKMHSCFSDYFLAEVCKYATSHNNYGLRKFYYDVHKRVYTP